MFATNDELEDEAYEHPRHIIDSRGGWDHTQAREDEREVDEVEGAVWEPSRDEIHDQRASRTNQEEERQRKIYLAFSEKKLRTDHAPNNGGSAKYISTRTSKVVNLIIGAQVWNITKHPALDS